MITLGPLTLFARDDWGDLILALWHRRDAACWSWSLSLGRVPPGDLPGQHTRTLRLWRRTLWLTRQSHVIIPFPPRSR